MASPQKQTHLIRDEAQLNCVALRPQLDYEVAWRPVKGQDERPKTAPLTALHAYRTQRRRCRRKTNMEGRHVGLDFYDLLIEVISRSRRPSCVASAGFEDLRNSGRNQRTRDTATPTPR